MSQGSYAHAGQLNQSRYLLLSIFTTHHPLLGRMSNRHTRLSRRHSALPTIDANRPRADAEVPTIDDDSSFELPVYSRRRSLRPPPRTEEAPSTQTEHSYSLYSRNDRPWLTLKISSWTAKDTSAPVFVEAESIDGHVELDLEKPDSIKAISITVCMLSQQMKWRLNVTRSR